MNRNPSKKNMLMLSQVYGLDHLAEIKSDNLVWGKTRALTFSIIDSLNLLISKGEIQFMSALDLANTYGFTRQYWDLLLASGKIPFYSHGGGKFTLNIYVENYLADRYGQEYVPIVKRTIRQARMLANKGRKRAKLFCPKCDSKNMKFIFAEKAANAKCRFCKYKISVLL